MFGDSFDSGFSGLKVFGLPCTAEGMLLTTGSLSEFLGIAALLSLRLIGLGCSRGWCAPRGFTWRSMMDMVAASARSRSFRVSQACESHQANSSSIYV